MVSFTLGAAVLTGSEYGWMGLELLCFDPVLECLFCDACFGLR
jgi:hypothetical protein